MNGPWQYALTVGPLGFYLWVLGLWQSGRHPRVVRGLTDFVLLSIGVGGVLAFGPFGQLVARMLFGRPGLLDWSVIVSGLGLGASLLARKALHRLAVYHVDPSALDEALGDVLGRAEGRFVRTLSGFEDRDAPRGLRVEVSRWTGCAVVEAYGSDPEGLIQEVRPRLRERLRQVPGPPSRVALALFGGSMLVMLAPVLGMFFTQPKAREAMRVLLERLRGV